MFIDLDNFKIYNDTLGHQAGDWLLKRFADLLRSQLRDVDVIGRYGGDEFLVLLPETRQPGARLLAERILNCVQESKGFLQELADYLQQPVAIPVGKLLSCSIRLKVFEADTPEEMDQLIRLADEKLYEAKNSGKSVVQF